MTAAVLGHRGASALALENTMVAFELALARGADGIEFDVQLSADGQVVVFHDRCLERLAPGRPEPVSSLSWGELADLVLLAGGRIPCLEQVLTALPEDAIKNVELKSFGDQAADAALLRAVLTLVRQRSDVVCSSFSRDVVLGLRDEGVETAALIVDGAVPELGWFEAQGIGAIHLCETLASPQTLARLTGAGLCVGVWTVNDRARWPGLAACGVRRIITDNP